MEISHFLDILESKRSISIDTRTLNRGDIFFALKGENFDGNKFVQDALKKGASLVISDDQKWADTSGVAVVDDVLSFMQRSATSYRNSLSCMVVGITGSNGKTTTKELCHAVVNSTLKCYSTRGNYNNHIGVPITLLSAPEDVEVLIVEMGANHQGEIDFLSRIANPDIGIITNIGKAHLEGFGGIEGVKQGKSELYRFIAEKGGTIIYNGKDEVLKALIPSGVSELVEYIDAEVMSLNPSVKLKVEGCEYTSQLFGDYNAINILCALTLGKYLGIHHHAMKLAIEGYCPRNNRSEVIKYKGASVIKDAYNANPTSVEFSLTNFVKRHPGKSIVILGDMLELGDDSVKEHEAMVSLLKRMQLKNVILIGPVFSSLKHPYTSFISADEVKAYFDQLNIADHDIFIKGSRGLRLEQLLAD